MKKSVKKVGLCLKSFVKKTKETLKKGKEKIKLPKKIKLPSKEEIKEKINLPSKEAIKEKIKLPSKEEIKEKIKLPSKEEIKEKIKLPEKIKTSFFKTLFSFIIQWWHFALGLLFAFLVLYFPVGAILTHNVDMNLHFECPEETSLAQIEETKEDEEDLAQQINLKTLKTISAVIDREVNQNTFTPNLPFLFPSALLDNMPAFQTGIIEGTKKIIEAFLSANPETPLLEETKELLAYPADVWHIQDFKPATSSGKKFNKASDLILDYYDAIQKQEVAFDTSDMGLASIILSLLKDLQEQALELEQTVMKGKHKLLDTKADEAFYKAKGNAYVFYLVLRDMNSDFSNFFKEEELNEKRLQALHYLEKALHLKPLIISNGAPETQFVPNHLLTLGFYLSQASLSLVNLLEVLP